MFKIKELILSILVIYLNLTASYCRRNRKTKYSSEKNLYNNADVKYFEVGITSNTELNTIKSIREHINLLENYNDQSYDSAANLTNSKNFSKSLIDDDVLFMESFISSFSAQSNISAPFSTNGVTIHSIPIHSTNCNSDIIFETSNEDINVSTNNHLISNLIPDLDQINRTISVIPWKVINNTILNLVPEIRKISYEFALICTSISNNIELLKFYSNSSDIKHVQWEALQMASFARGYSRYVLETVSLAVSLASISPDSKDEPSIFSDINFYSIIKHPNKLLNKLNENRLEEKENYECMDFFGERDVNGSCIFCFSIFLTLYSRIQCQYVEVGISRESILGVRWLEEIHSHIYQLNKFLLSVWNHFVIEKHPNSSHYTPPKPSISWKAFKLKLYEEFRIGLNLQQRIKLNSELDLSDNIFFNRYSKKESDINNSIELKFMESITNSLELNPAEMNIIEETIRVYNIIIDSMNFSQNEILLGSITKLSNSLMSVAIILGTYGDKNLINLTIQSLKEKHTDILSEKCKKLHREVITNDYFDQNTFTSIFVKYIYCKNNLGLEISKQVSLQYRYELTKNFLRKILISTRNSLFERIRERVSASKVNEKINFKNSFTKFLSQFQVIMGLVKIIRIKMEEINSRLNELLKLTDYYILNLEKFKIKLISFIFNDRYFFLEKSIVGELNDASYPIIPITVSLGPYLFDIAGSNLKMTVNKLRSKISLLNKLISFSRNIFIKRRYTINDGSNYHTKNKILFSTALRIYNNRDELIVINTFTIFLYKTLKNLGRTSLKTAITKKLIDENYRFDFGKDDRCNLKNNILSLKETEFIGCKLFNKVIEIIQIDELFSLLQKQFVNVDNAERKIYYEISSLFDEIWTIHNLNGNKVVFKNLSSKLYTLKSLLENMLIFSGIARNSLVPYINDMKNSECLYDFLLGSISSFESTVKEFPFIINSKGPSAFFKNIASAIKGIFSRSERIKNREKHIITKEVTKFSKILSSLEPYIINIDISFNLNVEKLRFIKIESQERIRKLFYLYTHCIYSTLKNTIMVGNLEKHFPTEVKEEWNEFIRQLNIVQASLLGQLYLILVSKFLSVRTLFTFLKPLFIQNLEIRNSANLIIKQITSNQVSYYFSFEY